MPIQFVRNVGTVQSKSTGTTITSSWSFGQATAAAGNRLVVVFSMDPAAGPVTCADTSGNVYVLASDVTNGSGTSGVREVTFTAHLTSAVAYGALSTGSVTVTHPSVVARSMSVVEFTGATTANDATAFGGSAATGTGTGAASLTKSDHVVGSERLFLGGIGREVAANTVTQPAGWTEVPPIGTGGGGAATNIHTSGGWRIYDSAPASVTYDPTHTASANWAGSLIAIRGTASDPAPAITHEVTASGASTTTGTGTAVLTRIAAANGVASSTGTASALLALRVTADGTATTTGAASATIVTPTPSTHDVAAVGQSATTGTASASRTLTVATTGLSFTTGQVAAVRVLTVTAGGSSTSTGVALALHSLVATAVGTSTTTGTAAPALKAPPATGVLGVTASGLSATTGTAGALLALFALASGVSTSTGDAAALRDAQGSATGLCVSSGTAVVALTLAAAAMGLSRTSGDVFTSRPVPVGAVVRLAQPRASVGVVRSRATARSTDPSGTSTTTSPRAEAR